MLEMYRVLLLLFGFFCIVFFAVF